MSETEQNQGHPLAHIIHGYSEGRIPMTRYIMSQAVALAALCVLVTATVLPLQSVFGEGGARRDVIHAEEQHRQEAITLAQEAADHGKQGHAKALLEHAEAALQHALKGDMDNPHVGEGISHLKEAIEHGKAGHADVATKHAETAVMHLSQGKKPR